MRLDRRRQVLLAILIAIAAAAAYLRWPRAQASVRAASSARTQPRRATAVPPLEVPDVHLEALGASHARPAAGERNLFRFRAKPSPSVQARLAPPPIVAAPSGPPPPPPLPPIPLKFIGLLQTEHAARVAILSDGRGPLYGKEGDAVLGQYRILHIASESIEMSYLDGRGRQTIRLSGS